MKGAHDALYCQVLVRPRSRCVAIPPECRDPQAHPGMPFSQPVLTQRLPSVAFGIFGKFPGTQICRLIQVPPPRARAAPRTPRSQAVPARGLQPHCSMAHT